MLMIEFGKGETEKTRLCLLKCDKGRVYIWQRPCLLKRGKVVYTFGSGRVYTSVTEARV